MSADSTASPAATGGFLATWNRFWHELATPFNFAIFRILFCLALWKEVGTTMSKSRFAIEGGVVKMGGAHIKDASIQNAHIAGAIQSSFVDFTSGYGWKIDKAGIAEFSEVKIYDNTLTSATDTIRSPPLVGTSTNRVGWTNWAPAASSIQKNQDSRATSMGAYSVASTANSSISGTSGMSAAVTKV